MNRYSSSDNKMIEANMTKLIIHITQFIMSVKSTCCFPYNG